MTFSTWTGGRIEPSQRIGHDGREQVELLLEERLVVAEVETEERERLDERASADSDLGTATADRVDGGEALEDADRVVAGQDRHRRAEADVLGAPREAGEQHVGGAHGVVVAVVLADAEEVEAEPVGELTLGQDLPDHRGGVERGTVGAVRDVAEGVEAEFEAHAPIVGMPPTCQVRPASGSQRRTDSIVPSRGRARPRTASASPTWREPSPRAMVTCGVQRPGRTWSGTSGARPSRAVGCRQRSACQRTLRPSALS